MYSTKICGKAHAVCSVCKPEYRNEAVRAKISAAGVGRTPWNKGLPMRESSKQKMIMSLTGKTQAPETIAKRAASLRGLKRTSAQVERLSEALIVARAANCTTFPSELELACQRLLEDAGLEYEAQVRFGRFCVDFYVPSLNVVFEADGTYWHNIENDTARDKILVEDFGVLAVIRLNEIDLTPYCVRGGQ